MIEGVRIEPLDRDQLRAAIRTGGGGPVVPDHIRSAILAGHVGRVVIFCDGCGIEEEGDYTGESREVRFTAARGSLAENKGWEITATTDLCRDCDDALAGAAGPPDQDRDTAADMFR